MDVQMVDVDGDFDLDFFGDNRGSNANGNHFLMLNDGTGVFSDNSTLLPATSTSCYEAEVGDLDNDQDIDLFFVSLSGFAEGAVKNNLVPSTALTFTSQGAFGGDDDNEIALLDYDVDGDYDVIVGSLASREKLYRNDGNFSFVDQSTQITAVSDSSLDCTVADLDNDGRYDLITAQGESNSAQWANKVYRNVTGPVDNRAPVLNALHAPAAANHNDPAVIVQAKVRDQVMDDGVDYLTATARSVALPLPVSVNVAITAAGFVPPISNIAPGTSVVFNNVSGAARTLASTTAPYVWSVNVPDGQELRALLRGADELRRERQPGRLRGHGQRFGRLGPDDQGPARGRDAVPLRAAQSPGPDWRPARVRARVQGLGRQPPHHQRRRRRAGRLRLLDLLHRRSRARCPAACRRCRRPARRAPRRAAGSW
jgi:hypothetical protein